MHCSERDHNSLATFESRNSLAAPVAEFLAIQYYHFLSSSEDYVVWSFRRGRCLSNSLCSLFRLRGICHENRRHRLKVAMNQLSLCCHHAKQLVACALDIFELI